MVRYSKILYPIINRIIRNAADTYDVLQETYIKVFSKINKDMQFGVEQISLQVDKTAAQATMVCTSVVVAKMIWSNF